MPSGGESNGVICQIAPRVCALLSSLGKLFERKRKIKISTSWRNETVWQIRTIGNKTNEGKHLDTASTTQCQPLNSHNLAGCTQPTGFFGMSNISATFCWETLVLPADTKLNGLTREHAYTTRMQVRLPITQIGLVAI